MSPEKVFFHRATVVVLQACLFVWELNKVYNYSDVRKLV